MPIYEYHCPKCDAEFEEIVGANDPAPACPSCHCGKTEKLISKASFHTGSGYSDYSGGYDAGSSSSGCAGCAGGNCASCH